MRTLGEIAIMGGGCYGRFYTRQLLRAREQGAVQWKRLKVVDHDPRCAASELLPEVPESELTCAPWSDFLDEWLHPHMRSAEDRIVPTPLMPHLFADWITRHAERRWPTHLSERVPIDEPIGTPFDMRHPSDGNRYLSHADWICPIHCTEPAQCPKIRAPRRWEMEETLRRWNTRRAGGAAELALVKCQHVVFGVGMVEVEPLLGAVRALDTALASAERVEMVIGSISSCHGAVGLLRVARRC